MRTADGSPAACPGPQCAATAGWPTSNPSDVAAISVCGACASAAADEGVPLRVLLAECLGPACRAWPDMPGARQAGERAELEAVAVAVIQAVGEASVALTEGYETAQKAAIRQVRIRRTGRRRHRRAVPGGRKQTPPGGQWHSPLLSGGPRIVDVACRSALSTPLVVASEFLVFHVLGRDRAAITDFVATVLGGLEDARGEPQPMTETLTAYFASGGVNTLTARRLRLSVRTVACRLPRARELTGYDPCDPARAGPHGLALYSWSL
ncbi:helix-turn-helix domain-containing protein [Streptomyces sp. NPDC004270]